MPYMYQSRAALSIICPVSFVPTPLLATWAFKKVGYKFHQELKRRYDTTADRALGK